jgi:hypothetical protein
LTWLKTFGGQNVSKKIPKYVKLDLVWWSKFLIIYNGVSVMFLQDFSTPDCILSCDSTLAGCGGLWRFVFSQNLSQVYSKGKVAYKCP